MEAKDKAKILVDRFTPYMYCYMGSGMLSNDYDPKVVNDNAKVCALICVDEIIDYLKKIELDFHSGYMSSDIKYWNEVKDEIPKL